MKSVVVLRSMLLAAALLASIIASVGYIAERSSGNDAPMADGGQWGSKKSFT